MSFIEKIREGLELYDKKHFGMTYTEHLDQIKKEYDCGMMPSPTTDAQACYFLCKYLLGTDWYVIDPVSQDQVNTEMVCEILLKYSPKFEREYRKWRKKR